MNAEQFWALVDQRDGDQCWPWLGGKNGNGRGRVRFNGRHQYAYRIAWTLAHGEPVPGDLLVCHHCDNPICVRPDHLFVGTSADNVQDMIKKGRGSSTQVWGEAHHAAVASDDVVREARERYALGGVAPCELASEFGVTRWTMQNWLRGRVRVAAGGPIASRLTSEATHGTYYLYSRKSCRCEPCRAAGARWRIDNKARRKGVAS